MYSNINIQAGPGAYEIIKDEGLNSQRVKVIAGASGGPKWLVLSGLDRVLPDIFKNRKDPLFFLGSSIGAWRSIAHAHRNPVKAIEKFEKAYLSQRYSPKPTIKEISDETLRVANAFLDDSEIPHILNHPFVRLNVLTVRSKKIGLKDHRSTLGISLVAAAAANLMSRNFIKFFFDRALFYDKRDKPPFFNMGQFPISKTSLNKDNFKQVLLATGAIPMAMKGEINIPGAPEGVYRDGGIIDYHLDIPFSNNSEDLVLYPHFYGHITPGWFDKSLKWRKPSKNNINNVVLVSPSDKFVNELPLKKIPDRKDFKKFVNRDEERLAYWKTVLDRNKMIGSEFLEAVESRKIRNKVQRLTSFIGT